MRRFAFRWRLWMAGLLAGVALLWVPAALAPQPAEAHGGETVTTELQPGWNLAGWTEGEAPVSAIFRAIPQLRGVYAWDVREQAYRWPTRTSSGRFSGKLTTLRPGMGLWLHLGGDEPFTWTRPIISDAGLVDLRPGWNLVGWAGEDGIATTAATVEAPSQMLEHWVWDREVLASFTRHHETGEPLPDALLDAMLAAKTLSSGVMTVRQLYFAHLDQAYHAPDFGGDSTAATRELHGITGFPYTPGTHFQSGWGHLFGYDARYYGYLWSHVFGDDMFTRFEEAGLLNAELGAEYRRTVLERGGSVDGDQLVRDFLGREPNADAFLRGLGVGAGE